MNINQAFNGIHGYDNLGTKIGDRYPPNEFLSNEMLFRGTVQAKKTKVIKNQQLEDYHMFRNRLPWELNQNAGDMFNAHNQQLVENEFRRPEHRQQHELTPTAYDSVNYGDFDTHHELPTQLNNNKFYDYHTNPDLQGFARVNNVRMQQNQDYKLRRSNRDDQFQRQNDSLQSHIFTPMSGTGVKTYDGANRPLESRMPFRAPK